RRSRVRRSRWPRRPKAARRSSISWRRCARASRRKRPGPPGRSSRKTSRTTKPIKELPRTLPDSIPLSGLSIGAVADRVVVKEGASRWQAESGQYLLEFEGDPADGSLSVIERKEAAGVPGGAQAW